MPNNTKSERSPFIHYTKNLKLNEMLVSYCLTAALFLQTTRIIKMVIHQLHSIFCKIRFTKLKSVEIKFFQQRDVQKQWFTTPETRSCDIYTLLTISIAAPVMKTQLKLVFVLLLIMSMVFHKHSKHLVKGE